MLSQSIHYAKKGVFTLLTLFLAIYVFTILLTYTPNDPSWSQISSSISDISNMGGAVGAWLADILYAFLGGAAWFLLLFFIFESVMLWRDNTLPAVSLRLLAYVFLLLSGSAIFSAIAIVWSTSGNIDEFVWLGEAGQQALNYGGIVGFEVLKHLAYALTVQGAFIFLVLFSIITVVFAFDINIGGFGGNKLDQLNVEKEKGKPWYALSRYLPSRYFPNNKKPESQDWGLDDDTIDEPATNNELIDEGELDIDSHGQLALKLPKQQGNISKTLHSKSSLSSKPQLQSQSQAQARQDRSSSVEDASVDNLFTDFLKNSGLSDTLRKVQEEALTAEQKRAEQLKTKHSLNSQVEQQEDIVTTALQDDVVIQHAVTVDVSHVEDVIVPDTSVEEDWRDQSVIDALLDEQDEAQAVILEPIPLPVDAVDDTVQSLQSAKPIETMRAKINATMPEPIEPEPMVQEATTSLDSIIEANEGTEARVTHHRAETIAPMGLTPTNTPPANPYKPNEGIQTAGVNGNSNSNSRTFKQDDLERRKFEHTDKEEITDKESLATTRLEPDIRFDVAEGENSNLIEDMVPDEAEETRLDKVMPPIEDDAAFKSKSRAMQTAAHRKRLTPIPSIDILDKPDPDLRPSYSAEELEKLSELLEIKLQDFNVKANVVNSIPGPVVTRFEVELAAGVKASKVTGISRDLARSLSMASLRVVEVIPGKPYIGIEVPNKKRQMVRLIELLTTAKYKDPKAQISMAMGKDIGGKPIITDLARAPHMLVAGTTGSGKSVLVNSMLLSMLLKYKPDELRLILIDPKQLELANYNEIPHLLTPVVTDMNEAASSLSWCVAEMERRYQLMSLLKVRKLGEFNKKVIAAEKSGKPMLDPLWRPTDGVSIADAPKLKTLPMIVIVADEFADMIMQVGKQAEELITRLAQKSRAAGIHLMLATQRPSVDVITGLIKANIPVRAALRVNSKVDSRTILDAGGAEDMLGNGDMLFLGPGQIEPERVHGAYVSDEEVNRVCDAWRERGAPDYIDNMASNFDLTSPSSAGNSSGEDDKLYDDAVAFVIETRKVSASSIQRKFSIGYNRAARIVDSMEEAGLVSAMGKSGKRELLM